MLQKINKTQSKNRQSESLCNDEQIGKHTKTADSSSQITKQHEKDPETNREDWQGIQLSIDSKKNVQQLSRPLNKTKYS